MKAVSRWLDRFCYDHPNFGVPNLMKYIVIGNVMVYFLDLFSRGYASWMLSFSSPLILQGQVWRVLSFVFVPVATGGATPLGRALFFAMTTLFYYYLGNALERQWGTTRFTVFYGLGVLLNIIMGFVMGGTSMYYINMTMFFAFATLYPEMQVLLFGILPLKVKWLAWLDAAMFAFDIFFSIFSRQWITAVLPLVALLNYFIFFWDDLMTVVRRTSQRAAYRANPQTINFKKAQKQVQERRGYLHKCAVCGITDADDPDMEFRYCSKCNGYYCYCMKHINDHVHVE